MKLIDTIINTERLILKPIDYIFAEEIYRCFTQEITLYMFPKPSESIDGVKNFIASSIRNIDSGTELMLAITLKQTGEFIGCCGLHKISRHPELGVWVKQSAHGNKYGLEAVSALVRWAKDNIDFEYLKYPVDRRNYASRRIAEQNGG